MRKLGLPVLAGLLLLVLDPVVAQSERGAVASDTAGAAKQGNACPAREFRSFFRVFAVHPELQRRYTSLPLEFGLLDQELIGTDREEEAYKTRAIRKFEEIPSYRPETGAILPTEAELKQDGLQFAITTRANSSPRKDADPERRIVDPNLATATLRIAAGAGFRIHYRFRLTSGCWFLFGISDRST